MHKSIQSAMKVGSATTLSVLLMGCISATHPTKFLVTTVPISRYMEAQTAHRSGHLSIDFPTIDLYNPAGLSVFHTQGRALSADDLTHLIKRRRSLMAQADSPKLIASTAATTEWHQEPEAKSRYTLVMAGTPECSTCAMQEKTIESLKPTFMRSSTDVLVLELEMNSR
jgi:hypothetical protein